MIKGVTRKDPNTKALVRFLQLSAQMKMAEIRLPQELDRCLHKNTPAILKSMAPDGVYVYLCGATLLDKDAKLKFHRSHDVYGKNHVLLTSVARQGSKGFHLFLEALETTQQLALVRQLKSTLNEKYSNEEDPEIIEKIKNPSEKSTTSTSSDHQYILGPRNTSSSSFSPSVSRSRSFTRTPLTPPLTEAELDEHLHRLKSLLRNITNNHSDRNCRHEASSLLGELEDVGGSMVDHITLLSEENAEKERELRRAKYMIRGLETEVDRLKACSASNEVSSTSQPSGRTERPAKSKLCVIL